MGPTILGQRERLDMLSIRRPMSGSIARSAMELCRAQIRTPD